MRDQTSLKAVQYFQVNFISTGSRLSPAQFSLDSEKSAPKHPSSIHPSTGSLTFFTHAQEPTHPIVYSLIYLITHSLAYLCLLICSFTCTLNCSLISLMILITPSLTHCDSYSYLLSLAQFKLLTHSQTFPLAQLLAHSVTDFFTCWIVWSFTRSSTHPPAKLFVHSHWLVHLFICWIVLSFTNPLAELFAHLLTDSSTHSLAELFARLLIHPLAHSLAPHCDVPPILQSKDEHRPCQNLCCVGEIMAGCWRTKTVKRIWYQLS